MIQSGFPAERVGDGVFVPDLGTKQQQALENAADGCNELALEAGLIEQPDMQDPAVLKRIYEELSALQACLVDHGLPASEPPSEEVFGESGGSWNPFSSLNAKQAREGDEECPSNYYAYIDLRDYGLGNEG